MYKRQVHESFNSGYGGVFGAEERKLHFHMGAARGQAAEQFPGNGQGRMHVQPFIGNSRKSFRSLRKDVYKRQPLARTTLYTYNDQFRMSLELKPNGGYTRYEYDEQGREMCIRDSCGTIFFTPTWSPGGKATAC